MLSRPDLTGPATAGGRRRPSGGRRRPLRALPTRAGGATADDDAVRTDLVRLRAAAGADLGDTRALPERAQRAVAVAASVGAPLLDALEGAAAAEADAARASRAIEVASAQTRAVAGGLVAAPLLLVPALGRLVGADLVGFYGSPTGAVVGAVGLTLLAAGTLTVRALVRRVGAPRPAASSARRWARAGAVGVAGALLAHPVVGLVLAGVALRRRGPGPTASPDVDEAVDLTATALAGGVPVGGALRAAADQLPAHARDLRRLAFELELGGEIGTDLAPGLDRLGAVLRTATTVGAPVVPALRRLAAGLRADDLARVLAAAERLPAQLTFPTALALLPATVLLVGAPIVQVGLRAAAP